MRWGAVALLLLGCPAEPEPLPPEPWDRDADGVDETTDCDDRDAGRFPGALEACDGVDQDCDGAADGEDDADGDGQRACAECDDARADVFVGAPSACDGSDADCDGAVSEAEAASVGEHPSCPALDCAAVEGLDSAWIDAGGAAPFEVECDGPWIHLALDSSDGLLVASKSPTNGWDKCDDDAARFWPWLGGEDATDVDSAPDWNYTLMHDAVYVSPASGTVLHDDGLLALSAHVTELHPDEQLVALTADNDGGDWQGGTGSGLEVYAVGADGTWHLLTPGSGGDCGGGSSGPTPGGESAFYLWASEAGGSQTAGDTGLLEPLGALPAGAALPVRFVLAVHTGGGVAVGWTGGGFRVR